MEHNIIKIYISSNQKEVMLMVDVALLGTGGGMPMPKRFLSSLLINYKGRKVLIDCGEGTQVSMRMLAWGFKSIDVICITHSHSDHTVGLPGLLATIGNSGRLDPITLIGPKGIGDIVNGLRVIIPRIPYGLNIIEAPENACDFKITTQGLIATENNHEISISALELEHSTPCLGYSIYINRKPRFEIEKALENNVPKNLWNILQSGNAVMFEGNNYDPEMVLGDERPGIKISYITDTRPIEAITGFISGSDLFICEGTYGDEVNLEKVKLNKHMTFSEAAELAREGNVKELILTHFSPSMTEPEEFFDRASSVFKNTLIGRDRMVKTLAFKND
jgi:ribonuclease Z